MIFIALFFFSQDVQLQRTVKLETEFAPRDPLIYIDESEHIYYRGYWTNHLAKLDPDGKPVYVLRGPGNGPGELNKPYCFTVTARGRLIVLHQQVVLAAFDAGTGTFIENIKKPFFGNRLMQWDDQHLLVVKDPMPSSKPGLALVNLETGEDVRTWFLWTEPRTKIGSSKFALVQSPDHTVYFQPGALPELYVIKPFVNEPHIWSLKPPAGYMPPPEKPLTEKDRFFREKVDAYYNGFTQVQAIVLLGEQRLVVCWKNDHGQGYTHQIYDRRMEQLLVPSLKLRGRLVAIHGEKLYTFDRVDPDDLDSDAYDQIHVYMLAP